jgi:hypothetical protein
MRAGVALDTRRESVLHGMIIEQQQIVTTQNLAALFVTLDLRSRLAEQLPELARRCFAWICQRQQVKIDQPHAQLIMLKNTAYAWRQMLFYLSLQEQGEVTDFMRWAEGHLAQQSPPFRFRFGPALLGLMAATEGRSAEGAGGRRFLGWSHTRHWLMSEPAHARN